MITNLIFLVFGILALAFCVFSVFENIWEDETTLLILIIACIVVAIADIRMVMNLLILMGW